MPLSATLAQFFDTSISAAFLAVVLPFMGVRITPALLWLPLIIVCWWRSPPAPVFC